MLVVTALIGDRDKRGDTVTAGEWAQSVCGAVGVWRGELEAIVEDIRTPNAQRRRRGAAVGDAAGPDGLHPQGAGTSVQATETLVEGVDNAGVPDTPEGEDAAQQVSEWADSSLDDLEEAQDSLDDEADTLEEAIEQLTGAARTIGSVLASGAADDRRGRPPRSGARRCVRRRRARASSCGRRRAR